MQKLNPEKKNARVTKLFIEPQDAYLIEEVKILFPDEYVEVYFVEEFTCDYSEFFCYDDMYMPDLPALIVCSAENELQVLEAHRNFDT